MWTDASRFRAGDVDIVIAFTDGAVKAIAERALGGTTVAIEGVMVTYGVASSPAGREGDVHELLWGSSRVLRTRHPDRLIRGIGSHLGAYAAWRRDAFVVDAAAVEVDGGVVLVPKGWRSDLTAVSRRLSAAGMEVFDSPWVEIDPAKGQVVGHRPLRCDWSALPGTRHGVKRAKGSGRQPLRAWVVEESDGEGDHRRRALGQMLSGTTRPAGVSLAAFVGLVADLAARIPTPVVAPVEAASLPSLLGRILGSGRLAQP